MPGLMHLVSMQQPAGVEAHFAEFVSRAVALHPEWTQSWFNPARTMHPFFRERLQAALTHTVHGKYRWGIKVPAKPKWLRSWHCRRALAEANPAVMLIWNRTAKIGFLLDAFGDENCIHWEHGSAWHGGNERDRARYLRRVPVAIANSKASARVLQLKWGYSGHVRICRNALRPSLMPEQPKQKAYPRNSAIRLGVAARLVPVKGVALVLNAVRALKEQAVDVELHVAGAGPDIELLRELARRLNVASSVRFHGAVQDMRSFYADVHCLVHPPLTEAFGLVAIEAAAQGVPVIAAAVDGLPEAVMDGVTGYCVRPEVPLSDYVALGARLDGIPERIYDPAADALHEPKIVDPQVLAAAVSRLFADVEAYETLSRSASEHVLREYQFDRHVEDVMSVVRAVEEGRGLPAPVFGVSAMDRAHAEALNARRRLTGDTVGVADPPTQVAERLQSVAPRNSAV